MFRTFHRVFMLTRNNPTGMWRSTGNLGKTGRLLLLTGLAGAMACPQAALAADTSTATRAIVTDAHLGATFRLSNGHGGRIAGVMISGNGGGGGGGGGGGSGRPAPGTPPQIFGTYRIVVRGALNGLPANRGAPSRATVDGGGVSIQAQVTDETGQAGSLNARCTLNGDQFKGTGFFMNMTVTIEGRVEGADPGRPAGGK